jgi:flagella basal body P-ring formation protein FlgA
MAVRSFFVAGALLAASVPALAGNDATPQRAVLASTIKTVAAIPIPALRDHINVTDEVVRIGDLVDNAGVAAQIAIYRSPDPGTTGTCRLRRCSTFSARIE